MLRPEAAWLSEVISTLPSTAFPLLDLGSSTGLYRSDDQAFINSMIFAPLARSGHSVIHADVKAEVGVDVVIDFTRAEDRQKLAETTHIGSVLCANLFEHLTVEPEEAAQALLELCRPGGYLLVTVPKTFRYHPDPIDNLYRPSAEELANLFGSRVAVLQSANVQDTLQIVHDIQRRGLPQYVASALMPWRMSRVWWGKLTHSMRRIEVACVYLQRVS
jgi:SAM-dependent methyltransferase